jgi:hypothetical protein
MPNSKIGQYQLEYRIEGFTAPTRSHALRLWIIPSGSPAVGTPPASVTIQKLGGSTASLQAVADQAWSFFRLAYVTTVQAVSFSLWKFATETARDFVTAGALTTPAGAAGVTTIAGQTTLTFRHALGGIGKIVLLESNLSGDTRTALVPNGAGTPAQRIAAYIMSADSPMIALDNSFPVSPLRDSRGQNEAIWRMVYRAGN